MATPIKETPILTGKDAKKFIEKMNDAHNHPVSKEERERIKKNYEELMAIADFS